MLIPFISLGFGFDGGGISPEVGLGAAFLPRCNRQSDSCMSGHVTTQPNHHQRQGKSRKGRSLVGVPKAPKQQSGSDFDVSKLFS